METRCDELYWKNIENMKYNYYFRSHESHLPTHTILHSFNTCSITSMSMMLQIALSYVSNKTYTEELLYKLLKLALIRGDEDDQLIFLNNMQCLIFNPTIAMNKRNKFMILHNIPIVSKFNVSASFNEIINYNIMALSSAFNINEKELRSRIRNISNKLLPYKDFIHVCLNTLPPSMKTVFINFYNDAEYFDIHEINKTLTTSYSYDGLKSLFIDFLNIVHEVIVEINQIFIDEIRKNDFDKCPYLYDLTTIFDPMLMKLDITDQLIGINAFNFKFFSKITDKNIDCEKI